MAAAEKETNIVRLKIKGSIDGKLETIKHKEGDVVFVLTVIVTI